MLEIRGINKNFGKITALKDVSFSIAEGEILSLCGASGCGKSTTLRIVAGLEYPDSGKISMNDTTIVDVGSGKFTSPEERNMGMVFQAFAVWPHMTVFDNIAFPLRIRRLTRSSLRQKVMESLELVGLADRSGEYPWQLSGGMQQRVALARAIVYSPDVLLLDEPLSNLDAKLREQMRVELRALQRKLGTTFLFVTHDQAEAMIMSTRIAVMNAGRVEQVGTPTEVYERPSTAFVRDFLGQTVLLPGTVRRHDQIPGVELDAGARLPLPEDHSGLSEGARVTMACRAECIRLLPAHEGGADRIAAVVEEATYIGDRVEYALRAGDRVLTVCCHEEERYSPGAQVNLGFTHRGITVWPDGD